MRRHYRIREEIPVRWYVQGKDLKGSGEVINISESGLLLKTDRSFKPSEEDIVILESSSDTANAFVPLQGRLIWSSRISQGTTGSLCGLKFIKPSDSVVSGIQKKVEDHLAQIAQAANMNILNNYV